MKRKWTNIQGLGSVIQQMRENGRTRQEIADELGLEKEQIKNWVYRYNRRQREYPAAAPKQKGRPRTRPLSEAEAMALRIKELEREVELYRAFLQAAGRM
jgi:hypothetical protein